MNEIIFLCIAIRGNIMTALQANKIINMNDKKKRIRELRELRIFFSVLKVISDYFVTVHAVFM